MMLPLETELGTCHHTFSTRSTPLGPCSRIRDPRPGCDRIFRQAQTWNVGNRTGISCGQQHRFQYHTMIYLTSHTEHPLPAVMAHLRVKPKSFVIVLRGKGLVSSPEVSCRWRGRIRARIWYTTTTHNMPTYMPGNLFVILPSACVWKTCVSYSQRL